MSSKTDPGTRSQRFRSIIRRAIFLVVLAITLLLLATTLIVMAFGISIFGLFGSLFLLSLLIGVLLETGNTAKQGRSRWLVVPGFLGLFIVAGLHITMASNNETVVVQRVTANTSTEQATTTLLASILPEQDLAIAAMTLRLALGIPGENRSLLKSMHSSYQELHAEFGVVPSPLLTTVLGLQRNDSFDLLIVRPTVSPEDHKTAVIFLHAAGSNLTVFCASISEMVQQAQATVFCPSLGFTSDWTGFDGHQVIEYTLSRVQELGFEKIIMAGYSDGATGLSQLIPLIEENVSGIVLISGGRVAYRATIDLPVLSIYGMEDQVASRQALYNVADQAGELGTFREVNGGHFLLFTHSVQMESIFGSWFSGIGTTRTTD